MTKLYCILARDAEIGVIFRRGPSRHVRLINWNLTKNTFEPGQWFKGRIYAQKSDLSPNGTKLVYFAAKHKGPLPSWIAVSNPPFLTALVLWRAMGTWNDLSLFETNNLLALATYRPDSSLEPETGFEIPSALQVKHKPWPGYFHLLPDHDRLIRDGWVVHEGDPIYRQNSKSQRVVYIKPILGGLTMVSLAMTANHRGAVVYKIHGRGECLLNLEADWAEVRGGRVLFSQGGKLLSMNVSKSKRGFDIGTPVELADFSGMIFEAVEAPSWATKW